MRGETRRMGKRARTGEEESEEHQGSFAEPYWGCEEREVISTETTES
jgi:hypothetical protein